MQRLLLVWASSCPTSGLGGPLITIESETQTASPRSPHRGAFYTIIRGGGCTAIAPTFGKTTRTATCCTLSPRCVLLHPTFFLSATNLMRPKGDPWRPARPLRRLHRNTSGRYAITFSCMTVTLADSSFIVNSSRTRTAACPPTSLSGWAGWAQWALNTSSQRGSLYRANMSRSAQ